MCEEAVIKGVDVARCISVERRVSTASRFHHVCCPKKESCVSPVTEPLEVVRVSKNIRRTNWKAIRQSAKSFEIAPRVTYA